MGMLNNFKHVRRYSYTVVLHEYILSFCGFHFVCTAVMLPDYFMRKRNEPPDGGVAQNSSTWLLIEEFNHSSFGGLILNWPRWRLLSFTLTQKVHKSDDVSLHRPCGRFKPTPTTPPSSDCRILYGKPSTHFNRFIIYCLQMILVLSCHWVTVDTVKLLIISVEILRDRQTNVYERVIKLILV